MSVKTFEYGDNVKHAKRPEWGIGTVIKVERFAKDDITGQRLTVRFPNGGLRTLTVPPAELEVSTEPEEPAAAPNRDLESAAVWDKVDKEGWLGSVAKRKSAEAIIAIPLPARDPFNGLSQRLAHTLELYRFDRTGSSLIDWAVAQTGLDDPLTHYTRHELEHFFDRFAYERDEHLRRLLDDCRHEPGLVRRVMAKARPSAQQAVRRLTPSR